MKKLLIAGAAVVALASAANAAPFRACVNGSEVLVLSREPYKYGLDMLVIDRKHLNRTPTFAIIESGAKLPAQCDKSPA